MTKDESIEILKQIQSEVFLISSNVKKICRELKIGVTVREIKPKQKEYYETEIPEVDELDKKDIEKIREIISETT